jgi:hypothetical protein
VVGKLQAWRSGGNREIDAHAHQGKKDIMIVICSFINTAPEDVKTADHVSTIANHPNSTKEKKKRKEEAHEFRSRRRRRTRRRRKEMMTKYALLLYSTTKQGAGRSKSEALSKVGGTGRRSASGKTPDPSVSMHPNTSAAA